MIVLYNIVSDGKLQNRHGWIFVNKECLGKTCWNPCEREINLVKIGSRSNVMKQHRKSKKARVCCTRYAKVDTEGKIGCPEGYEYDPTLAQQRIEEGWRS